MTDSHQTKLITKMNQSNSVFRSLITKLIAVCFLLTGFTSLASMTELNQSIQSIEQQSKPLKGYSFYVANPEFEFALTHGEANPEGKKLTSEHVFRIASVTKTFTAATLLRLIEAGKINLDRPISLVLSTQMNQYLLDGRYDTSTITVRQLMNHTAGLFDHAQSADYLNQVMATPQQEWTPAEQINGAISWGQPIASPGEKYAYSDTGYVLLGHIIEQVSGMALPVAVRHFLNLDASDMSSVVWERGDSKAVNHEIRVHQYFQGQDTYDWNPTMDLFGGGGLLATPKDMASFYRKLFNGEVFEHKATLHLMLSPRFIPRRSPYRLGIFETRYNGLRVYEHSGFWGTMVMYDPSTQTSIAGAVLETQDYKSLVKIMSDYLTTLNQPAEQPTSPAVAQQ